MHGWCKLDDSQAVTCQRHSDKLNLTLEGLEKLPSERLSSEISNSIVGMREIDESNVPHLVASDRAIAK